MVPLVVAPERWVRGLRNKHHPLPSAQALQVDILLPALAGTRRDEYALAFVIKTKAAEVLIFL
jgi:hypothetical protein